MAGRIKRKLGVFRCRYLHRYKYPVLFLSCCPKSASTWFGNLLARIVPGYHYDHPDEFRRPDGAGTNITDAVLRQLEGRYVVARSHTDASSANLAVMDRAFGRYMFLARDPRDVAVSLYHHLHRYPRSSFIDTGASRQLPWRPLPSAVLQLEKPECIDVIIDQLLPSLVGLTRRWLKASRDKDNVLVLTYESITKSTADAVHRVLDFYGISVSEKRIERTIHRLDRRRLEVGRWKFRKGDVGDWKTELEPYQQQAIEHLSGNVLTDLGYAVSRADKSSAA